MKLLANENFPMKSFHILLEPGYDIKHIGVENAGISDEEVMNFSVREGRIIVTFDSDYGELVYKNGYKPAGVIYLGESSTLNPLEFLLPI
jgi:predicted nuclease of predicted toxin-antitoxin system